MSIIAFTSVKKPYGWLGNMSPYPVTYEGKEFRTTEALFQAMRFMIPVDFDLSKIPQYSLMPIIEQIRNEKSPMGAKMVAKKNKEAMVIPELGEKDVGNMRVCLRLKLAQHPELVPMLLDTGDATIIENVTARPHGNSLFWGMAYVDEKWGRTPLDGYGWNCETATLGVVRKAV